MYQRAHCQPDSRLLFRRRDFELFLFPASGIFIPVQMILSFQTFFLVADQLQLGFHESTDPSPRISESCGFLRRRHISREEGFAPLSTRLINRLYNRRCLINLNRAKLTWIKHRLVPVLVSRSVLSLFKL